MTLSNFRAIGELVVTRIPPGGVPPPGRPAVRHRAAAGDAIGQVQVRNRHLPRELRIFAPIRVPSRGRQGVCILPCMQTSPPLDCQLRLINEASGQRNGATPPCARFDWSILRSLDTTGSERWPYDPCYTARRKDACEIPC
jgi:hypothetical protein